MSQGFFYTLLVKPLYNGLIFIVSILPGSDAGVAIILITLLVKIILFPLSKKAIETQVKMKHLEGDLTVLKDKHKDNKEKHAQAMMALYKERGVNPFSSFFLLLVQLPIIFALYNIFIKNALPAVDQTMLYSFVHAPTFVSTHFLGIIDISQKSAVLALLAAISQFFQARYSLASMPAKKEEKGDKPSFQADFARSMNLQMKYVLPVITFFIAYKISAAVALYWLVSNLWAIGQELLVRRRIIRAHAIPQKP